MADGLAEAKRHLAMALMFLVVLYVVAIFVYHKVEGWNYLDSAYFVTITICTIGYGDFTPKTDLGKVITMFLAFIGISLAFYLITTITLYRERTIDTHITRRLNILRDITGIGEKPETKNLIKLKKKLEGRT
jgi:phage shock protein PspC (stress-responsive transcriptional regulator)